MITQESRNDINPKTPSEKTETAHESQAMLCEGYGALVADLMMRHRDASNSKRALELEAEMCRPEGEAYLRACQEIAGANPRVKN